MQEQKNNNAPLQKEARKMIRRTPRLVTKRVFAITTHQTPALFMGQRYADVVVNEVRYGEIERSGCRTDYRDLAVFVDAAEDVSDEEKERAKRELRAIFGIPDPTPPAEPIPLLAEAK